MKKIIILLSLSFIILLFIVNCNQKKSKIITINLVSFSKSKGYKLCRYFEKTHPGVKVNYRQIPWSRYAEKLMTEIAGGSDDLDIIEAVDVHHFAPLLEKGLLESLDKFMSKEEKETYYPWVLKRFSKNGKVYGIPLVINVEVTQFNITILEELGLDIPKSTTLNDVFKLTLKYLKKYPNRFGTTHIGPDLFLRAYDVNFVDDINNPKKAIIDTPNGLKAIEHYLKFINTKGIVSSPLSDYHEMVAQNWGTGKMPYQINWASAVGGDISEELDIAVTSVPKAKRPGGINTFHGFMIPKNSKHKKLAYKLAVLFSSTLGYKYKKHKDFNALAPNSLLIQKNRKHYNKYFKSPANFNQILISFKENSARPRMVNYTKYIQTMSTFNHELYKGRISIEKYLKTYEKVIQENIDSEKIL